MKKIIIITISILLALTLAFVAYGAVEELLLQNTDNGSPFDRMIRVMERTIEDPMEFNDMLFNFEFIRTVYELSDADMDFIANLIAEGRHMEDVIRLTYFWLETNEDIGIVREIYDIKDEFGGSGFWMDFAFNYVTNNRHGVLTDEEVNDYLEIGLDFEDIHVARVLSRQGVMTIHEILDERAEGLSFSELAAEIDSEPVQQRNRSRRVRVNRENARRHRNLRSQSDVLMSRTLSIITGEDLEVFLEAAENDESLEIIFEYAIEYVSRDIMRTLRERGVLQRPRYGFPGDEIVVEQFRAEIMNYGISERTLNALFDEGFEYSDILNAVRVANGTGMDIRELLERVRAGESWMQIVENLESEGV